MTQSQAAEALDIHNRPTPTGSDRPTTFPTYQRPSDTPTVPAPRPLPEEQQRALLGHFRRQQAKLATLAAQLKALGVDPAEAWDSNR